MPKTLAICFARRPGGEILCLLCGSETSDEPRGQVPYKQTTCHNCGRDVAGVASQLQARWSTTTSEAPPEFLTVGELRRALAGEADEARVYFRDLTFGLMRARSVITGIVVGPAGKSAAGGHLWVGPFPVEYGPRLEGADVELVSAAVVSTDSGSWEEARKRGGYPAILPSPVWFEETTR